MPASRRRFLQAMTAALLPASLAGQGKKGMLVRSARPEDLEMPLEGFFTWITPVEQFFVRTHDAAPRVEVADWKLAVDGAVASPLTLSLDELRQLPRAELVAVLECAGNGRALHEPRVPGTQWQFGAVGNGRWTGVRLADVLRKAGLKGTAREILFDGADTPPGTMPEFQRAIPIEKALEENTLLAFEMNGAPLAPSHGFPLRVVAPGWAGDSWVKWVTRISVLEQPFEGFFMSTAYRRPVRTVAPGTPVEAKETEPVTTLRVKSVIASPPDGFWLAPAPVRVRGAAWSGESPVTAVEVSTDSGRNWQHATLGPDKDRFAWRLWEYHWKPEGEGYFVLMARASDASGAKQPLVPEWNPGGYLWNAVAQSGVTISASPPDLSAITRRVTTSAAGPPPPPVKTACLVCHDDDIIRQQALTRAQWEKELDKMERWGAKVRPADRDEILNYLVQFGPR